MNMTIEQTLEIPANRRLTIEVPREIPAGRIKLTLTPVRDRESPPAKIRLTKPVIDEILGGESLRSLTGLLHTTMTAEEIRTERLKKHDHLVGITPLRARSRTAHRDC